MTDEHESVREEGQRPDDTQSFAANLSTFAGGDPARPDAHPATVVPGDLFNTLREYHRQRQDLHRSEKSMTLRIKAKCRRIAGQNPPKSETETDKAYLERMRKEGDKIYRSMMNGAQHEQAEQALIVSESFLAARRMFHDSRSQVEKQMRSVTEAILEYKPEVKQWLADSRGVGIDSVAAILAETGDLSNYANPARVWKRMGLAVIGGRAQRKAKGVEAMDQGFSPSRRSIMWNVGECLVKQGEEYRRRYLERKEYEAAKVPEDQGGRPALWHARAKRKVEKDVLKDMWNLWNQS